MLAARCVDCCFRLSFSGPCLGKTALSNCVVQRCAIRSFRRVMKCPFALSFFFFLCGCWSGLMMSDCRPVLRKCMMPYMPCMRNLCLLRKKGNRKKKKDFACLFSRTVCTYYTMCLRAVCVPHVTVKPNPLLSRLIIVYRLTVYV